MRALPGASTPHVPAALRDRLATAIAEGIEAALADGPDRCLELGRTKLLLGPCPVGLTPRDEMAERLRLWEAREWETLLVRAETQAREKNRGRNGPTAPVTGKGKRARALVRSGAFRKGVAALTGSLAPLTPEQEVMWGRKLLPQAEAPGGAIWGESPAGPVGPGEVSAAVTAGAGPGVVGAAVAASAGREPVGRGSASGAVRAASAAVEASAEPDGRRGRGFASPERGAGEGGAPEATAAANRAPAGLEGRGRVAAKACAEPGRAPRPPLGIIASGGSSARTRRTVSDWTWGLLR